MEDNYSVVHFLEENSVEVVPITWISEDKKFCKWPNAKNKKSIKSLKKSSTLPGEDWTNYQARILGSYVDYNTARNKCKIAEVTSDLETGVGRKQILSQEDITTEREPPSDPAFASSYVEQISELPLGANPIPVVLHDSAAVTELASTFAEFQKVSLESQEQMKAEIKELKQLLQRCLAQSATNTVHTDFPLLPACDHEELTTLEVWMTNAGNFASMVKLLSKIGGSGAPKVVYNILAHVFSHDLAKTLRLTTKSGKTAVVDLKITRAVIEAAVATPGIALTEEQAKSHVGTWFRSVEDRKGGRSKRKQAQQAAGAQDGHATTHEDPTD